MAEGINLLAQPVAIGLLGVNDLGHAASFEGSHDQMRPLLIAMNLDQIHPQIVLRFDEPFVGHLIAGANAIGRRAKRHRFGNGRNAATDKNRANEADSALVQRIALDELICAANRT